MKIFAHLGGLPSSILIGRSIRCVGTILQIISPCNPALRSHKVPRCQLLLQAIRGVFMLGAIAGDIIGSAYEFHPWKGALLLFPLFPRQAMFTDDTVMTMAVAKSIMESEATGKDLASLLVDNFHSYGHAYPDAGYGGRFRTWLFTRKRESYGSFGNGSAMRVSPAGWAAATLEETEKLAEITAAVTHDHPEGIKGAQAVAGSIFLARNGASKEEIKAYVTNKYGYNLERTIAEIQPLYGFDETCQGSVPEAIQAFLESDNYELAVRKAVWLGGDADTQADIAGAIAEAMYGIPEEISKAALDRLDSRLYEDYRTWQAWLAEKR